MQHQDKINAYFDDPAVRRGMVNAVSRLVAIRSVGEEPQPGMPYGGGPALALAEALSLCAELGFETHNHENYVGTADLNGKETQLHILGHLDVVGEGSGWSTDPYSCTERDGVLYGRGVADDKGPVVAALFALKAVRDLELPLRYNAKLIMGTDEESGSSDLVYYYGKEPYAPYAFTPDADFPVIHVEKGHYHPDFGMDWAESAALPRVTALKGGFRTNVVPPEAWADVAGLDTGSIQTVCDAVAARTKAAFTLSEEDGRVRVLCAGKNAHAAAPDGGNNAISALLEALSALPLADCGSTGAVRAMHERFPHGDNRGAALGIAQEDAASGVLTLNLALMTLTEKGFTAKFDARCPICATEENCKAVCEAALARHGIAVTGDGEMEPYHAVSADSPLVKTLLSCYSAYTGVADPKPIAIGGGTYVHEIPGGVAFGCEFPGADPRMHGADERMPVDDLLLSAKIFAQAVAEICG